MFKRILTVLCAAALLWISASLATTNISDTTLVSVKTDGQSDPLSPDDVSAGSLLSDKGEPADPVCPQQAEQGAAAVNIASDAAVTSESYTAEHADENALRIAGNVTVLMNNIAVGKTGDTTNVEHSSLYGQNAGLLVINGASATISQAQVNTEGSGANGVFSYGVGTNISISDSTITTRQDHAGGILAVEGGMISADNLTVETQGNASAAIHAGWSGSTVTVDGGTYTTKGTASPAIDSAATVTASNATLTSAQGEAIVVEGRNRVSLINSHVSGKMQGKDAGENIHNVLFYQSDDGRMGEGSGFLSMTGGSMTALAGDMFYVTNTVCDIILKGVTLTLANRNLLEVAGNDGSQGWGKAGSNGGECYFTANGQMMSGTISVDAISRLVLSLENGTAFTGTINPDGKAGTVSVTLDDTSTWTLTDDAYVTSFTGSRNRLITNGYTLHVMP